MTSTNEQLIGKAVTNKTLQKIIRAGKRPLRKCQSLHNCFCCGGDIKLGEMYQDGGYGSRVHEECYDIMCANYGSRLAELAQRQQS